MNRIRIIALAGLLSASCATQPQHYGERRSDWNQLQNAYDDELAAEQAELPQEASLDELVAYARVHNAGLRAAFQNWKASLDRVPQANSLPNPRITFGAYLSEVETRVGPMQARLGVSQSLPWFGKRALAGGVAFEGSEAAREALEAARLELDERVRRAWYELIWAGRAIAITEGNRELLVHWESIARSRMETGLTSYADVLRAQIELGKLEDRVQSLRDLRRPLAAALNAALNRDPGAALPQEMGQLEDPSPLDAARLSANLMSTSPVIRAIEHRIRAAERAVELAHKAYYPDFIVGADYTFIGSAPNAATSGSGDDALAVTLGLSLPIWRGSYDAGVDEAEARAKAARLEQEQTQRQLAADLEVALYQVRDADRRVKLFRDSLVPKGEASIQALDIAYQAGESGFLDLLDAQRVLLEFQLQVARAATDRAAALAATERITGLQLNQER